MGLIPDGILDSLPQEEREEGFGKLLSEVGIFAYAAEDETARVVGFVIARPSRSREFHHEGGIYSLYVVKELQRRGIGEFFLDFDSERLTVQ